MARKRRLRTRRRRLSRARARRPERPHRGRVRRRPPGRAVLRGRRRARARPRGALPQPASARRASDRARRGRRPGRADARAPPGCRRAGGFLDFLAGEIAHPGLKAVVTTIVGDGALRRAFRALPASPEAHHVYAGGLLEHTVGVATICRSSCSFIRGCGPTSCSAQGSCTMSAVRAAEAGAGVPGHRRGPTARSRPSRPAARRAVGEARRRRRAELLHDRLPPRRACRTNRGGGLPLPREPAGRAGRYTPVESKQLVTWLGELRREPVPGTLAVVALVDARGAKPFASIAITAGCQVTPKRFAFLRFVSTSCGHLEHPLEEVASAIACVGDIQPEVAELRVLPDPVGVGDRLAIAGASPRRPDVDEDRLAALASASCFPRASLP